MLNFNRLTLELTDTEVWNLYAIKSTIKEKKFVWTMLSDY